MVVDISSDPFFQGRPGIRMFPGLCFFGVLYISAVPLFQARPRRCGCCLGSAFSGAAGGLVYFLGSAFSGGIRMFPGFCSAGILGDPHVSWVLLFQAWQRIPDISWVPLFRRDRRSDCFLDSAFLGGTGGLVYFLGSAFSGLTADADVSWVMLCQAWPWLHLKKAPQRGTEEAEERETEEERQAHSKYQLLFIVILFLARAVEVL